MKIKVVVDGHEIESDAFMMAELGDACWKACDSYEAEDLPIISGLMRRIAETIGYALKRAGASDEEEET